jgi:exodeoxyribonuclease V gamma subunit
MLHVHRAERADTLAEALAGVLAVPPADPFATEIVAVPAKGVERWLAHRLSHRLGTGPGSADGVCAGVAFPSPAAVVATAVAGALDLDADADPWQPARMVWPLLDVIDGGADPQLTRPGRRWATARALAELFGSYSAHRPGMLRGWLAGEDAPGDLGWQSALFRRLRERIGAPAPAERLLTVTDVLRREPERAALPERLSLFGPTRLTPEHLAVLGALAAHRDVHLWLPHPSPALWAQVAALAPAATPTRAADPTAAAAHHPLLSSLGRDVRELQVGLLAELPGHLDHHHPTPDPPDTLLGRLQRELRTDRPGAPAPADGSIQVHACHGAHRQVEVLREVVLGLLAADATLEPRDVLVMCPDIETFAPLISAAFGLGSTDDAAGGHPGQHLRVRLADRALRQVNPLLDTVGRLLELAGARLTSSELLDLLASEPVRRRFRLDADDVVRVRELVVASGVRWGLDAAHRGPYRLDGFGQNTWAAGLDRLLLGVTMSSARSPGRDQEWLGTALPLDQVESGDVERVGQLAEFVHRLTGVLSRLRSEQPLAEWVGALTAGLDALTDTSATDEWQAAQARGELAEALRTAGPRGSTVPLAPADVRALLDERLRGRPGRANFRTGTLTVATLVPMRSVPHRVVCLLGLDDGVFPRAGVPDGDDVLARAPLAGERDARSEDRQLLLDAVCAATEHLVVVHSGADERSGARRPPAVPLGELLDAVEAITGSRESVVVRHPLQPFDARNFAPGCPFSFDRAELAGALAAAGAKSPPAPFLAAPLAATHPRVVDLDELVAFAEHPVKAFLKQRVGLSLVERDDDPADALPIELDGLAQYQVGERLLRDRLDGRDLAPCIQAEWRRGELPPGALGQALLTTVVDGVEPLVATAQRLLTAHPASRDVDVELPCGTRVAGTLGGLHGATLLRVQYSRLKPKQRIRAWVRLLALTAATGEPWSAVSVGRAARHGIARATIAPVDPDRARALLSDLVALHREGLREPLPLATQSAAAYVKSRAGHASPEVALADALREWTGAIGEAADAAHVRVWGPGSDELRAQPGPPGGEPTRFGTLARRLWEPLLSCEAVDFP